VTLDPGEVIAQIDEVLADTDQQTAGSDTRRAAAVFRLAPPGSVYVAKAQAVVDRHAMLDWTVHELGGILTALKEDFERGYLATLEQQVRAGVLEDFLSMATEIARLHVAPAAVLAGAVLEEHTRRLADANGIETTKPNGGSIKFETLSQDLVKANVVSEPERKLMAGWYGQRTEGAHGRFDNVTEDIARLVDGVRDFIVRHPA
jgi:hypothetical protein